MKDLINDIKFDIRFREIVSAYIEAPFDEGEEILRHQGYKIISAEKNARLRIQEGKDAYVSQRGNWTREGVLYVPKKGIFLTKKSPIMEDIRKAAQCDREGKEYFLTDAQVEESLVDSVELSGENIPTNRLGENKITEYLFGRVAGRYGEFLREAGINGIPVCLSSSFMIDKPFVRQLWFYGLEVEGGRPGLCGNYGRLKCSNNVRGVYNLDENLILSYLSRTEREIRKCSQLVQGVREGKLPNSQLEKVLGFFEELREIK
jgi:hypothetical protein